MYFLQLLIRENIGHACIFIVHDGKPSQQHVPFWSISLSEDRRVLRLLRAIPSWEPKPLVLKCRTVLWCVTLRHQNGTETSHLWDSLAVRRFPLWGQLWNLSSLNCRNFVRLLLAPLGGGVESFWTECRISVTACASTVAACRFLGNEKSAQSVWLNAQDVRAKTDLFSRRFREGISFPNFAERSFPKLPLSKPSAVPFALQNRALFEGRKRAKRRREKGRKRGGQQRGQKGKKDARK